MARFILPFVEPHLPWPTFSTGPSNPCASHSLSAVRRLPAAQATEQSSASEHIGAYYLQAARMADLESSSRRSECAGGLDDVLNDGRCACDTSFIRQCDYFSAGRAGKVLLKGRGVLASTADVRH